MASEALLASGKLLKKDLVDICNLLEKIKKEDFILGFSLDKKDKNELIEKLKKIEILMKDKLEM